MAQCEDLIRANLEEGYERIEETDADFEATLKQIELENKEAEFKRLDSLLLDENGNNIFNKNYHKFQGIDMDVFWEWTKRHPGLQFTITIGGKSELIQNGERIPPPTPRPTYKIILDKDMEAKVLKVYRFFNDVKERHGKTNTFRGITQTDFLKMVYDADFSRLRNSRDLQRKHGTIAILSKLLNNKEWGEQAARSLGKTLEQCNKRTGVSPCEELKTIVLQ
jgi:hypothetical protein